MIRQTPLYDFINLFESLSPTTTMPIRVSRSRYVAPDRGSSSHTAMPIDCYTTSDQAVVLASMPGVHPDDISVSVKKNLLTISGRIAGKRKERDEHGEPVTWFVSEIPRGAYQRQIQLPFAIEEDQVEAQFSNGMLRIVLPRLESSKPHSVSIQVLESRFPEIAAESQDDGADSTETESFSAD